LKYDIQSTKHFVIKSSTVLPSIIGTTK